MGSASMTVSCICASVAGSPAGGRVGAFLDALSGRLLLVH